MNVENLDDQAVCLQFTPMEMNFRGEWDTPRKFLDSFELSYQFPVAYAQGEITLQEGSSLAQAVALVTSCQQFDGGGVVIPIVRPKGGRKVRPSPWGGKQPPSEGARLEFSELEPVAAHAKR